MYTFCIGLLWLDYYFWYAAVLLQSFFHFPWSVMHHCVKLWKSFPLLIDKEALLSFALWGLKLLCTFWYNSSCAYLFSSFFWCNCLNGEFFWYKVALNLNFKDIESIFSKMFVSFYCKLFYIFFNSHFHFRFLMGI